MPESLIGFIPLWPPQPFRIKTESGEITAQLLGRFVPIYETFRGVLPVLQFTVKLPGDKVDAVVKNGDEWRMQGKLVELPDAHPWLENFN